MTSSENQASSLSASDEQTVTYAKESLTTLLRKDRCTPEEISSALEYLTELKNRITDVSERRPALQSEYERYSRTCRTTTSTQQRLDHDIIEAKLRISELLGERDSIARDLARATRALNETDDPLHSPISGSTHDGDSATSFRRDVKEMRRTSVENYEDGKINGGITSEDEVDERNNLQEQHNIDALQSSLTNDMERLRVAEEELIDVVDEINSARKKRAELQEKVKAAQEEW